MKTDVQKEEPVAAGRIDNYAALEDEAASLVELTKNKINRDNLTPCPSCYILVPIKANHCSHCNSNIAANNALMRESMKRLDEIRAELDGQHLRHVKNRRDQAKTTLGERIRRLFSNTQTREDSDLAAPDPKGPRILDTISNGDQLKVLESDDPWYKVKTRDGRTGWVFSTLTRKP
jgi:hypothetical protein